VKLNGEAFFNITPNPKQPFYIEASNDVEIRVVGTSFNVKSFDAYTEVIVETGIVEVRKFNRVLLLHPREKARIDKEDSTIVVQRNSDKLYKYYRSKEFECDNTPLWKVVEVLNEAYGDSIVIGRNDLKSLTLTTRFDNESLESILEVISETFEIKVEKKGNKYILK
jgi:transmembrane sensor